MTAKKQAAMWLTLLFVLFSLYPIYYVLMMSLRSDDAFFSRTGLWISESADWKNYINLIKSTDFLIWLRNSALISFVVTLVSVILAAMGGYALSRFRFAGRSEILLTLLLTQMFPATMLILPFYLILSYLHMTNSFFGLFIIYSATALPFCIWQMKGYFDALPFELEEAARLDGCTRWQVFSRIMLPLAAPALVITGIFSFLASWSEYCVAAVVLQDPNLYTLPLGLKSFQSSLATSWGLYAAAAILVGLPSLILFILSSRFLITGMMAGSVKG